MKKSYVVMFVVLSLAGGALWFLSRPGGPETVLSSLISSDRTNLSDLSFDFLEDLQFKDFQKASTYHLPATQAARNIPDLIRRVFGIKHEVLDIKRYEILDVDLDRSGTRARVRAMVYFRVLGDTSVREHQENDRNVELLFYWFRQPDGEWAMELESSLR